MDPNSFFDNLRRDDTPEDNAVRAQRQLSYEERVIKRVITECGAKTSSWGLLANHCRRATGEVKLNFNWFNQTFKQFPGELIGRRIPRLHELTIQDLFKPSAQNRLVKAIIKNVRRAGVDPAASRYFFVFPVVRTSFCAHNLKNLEGAGDHAIWSCQTDDNSRITVEPTRSLFAELGHDWFIDALTGGD